MLYLELNLTLQLAEIFMNPPPLALLLQHQTYRILQ